MKASQGQPVSPRVLGVVRREGTGRARAPGRTQPVDHCAHHTANEDPRAPPPGPADTTGGRERPCAPRARRSRRPSWVHPHPWVYGWGSTALIPQTRGWKPRQAPARPFLLRVRWKGRVPSAGENPFVHGRVPCYPTPTTPDPRTSAAGSSFQMRRHRCRDSQTAS